MLTRALLVSFLFASSARADDKCPAPVKAAVDKAYPKAAIASCKAEKDQFEVKLTKADGAALELDVSADGKILEIEEVIALDKVPAAVMKAFAAKYPKAKASKAEKQTHTKDSSVSYELAFDADGKKKEATFTQDGKFVEEE
jgi:hypothetical protein